jgi:hypothetical protein
MSFKFYCSLSELLFIKVVVLKVLSPYYQIHCKIIVNANNKTLRNLNNLLIFHIFHSIQSRKFSSIDAFEYLIRLLFDFILRSILN